MARLYSSPLKTALCLLKRLAGTQMYSFYKENPRTMPGFTAGNLRAPPAPTAQQASMAAHHAFSAATGPTARHSGASRALGA